jgi:hypothetical protein
MTERHNGKYAVLPCDFGLLASAAQGILTED